MGGLRKLMQYFFKQFISINSNLETTWKKPRNYVFLKTNYNNLDKLLLSCTLWERKIILLMTIYKKIPIQTLKSEKELRKPICKTWNKRKEGCLIKRSGDIYFPNNFWNVIDGNFCQVNWKNKIKLYNKIQLIDSQDKR